MIRWETRMPFALLPLMWAISAAKMSTSVGTVR
jgi:hypothetical protein